MRADLDPRDLDEVRRRVVEPVVASVIGPDELDELHLYVEDGFIWMRVMARQELAIWCTLGSLDTESWSAAEMADRCYELITQDLPTATFAWGEQREGRYQVPGPSTSLEPHGE